MDDFLWKEVNDCINVVIGRTRVFEDHVEYSWEDWDKVVYKLQDLREVVNNITSYRQNNTERLENKEEK